MNYKNDLIPHHTLKMTLANFITPVMMQVCPGETPEVLEKKIIEVFIIPPLPEQGDLSLPLFSWGKSSKTSPALLAKKLFEITSKELPHCLKKIEAIGPYLNFFWNLSFVEKTLQQEIISKSYFQKKFFTQTLSTMVEYSQPNTHKELHVGHLRNVCLGQTLVELFKYCQIPTQTCTYPGDSGNHVAKCLWYLNKEKLTAPEKRKGAWLGSIYTKAHLLLESQRDTPQEEINRLELTAILKELHGEKGHFFDLWKKTREWSLEQMREVYSWMGVTFDHWFFESQVDKASLKLVDHYLEKGLFEMSEGAVGINLDTFKLGFCLLRKSDGNGLYATKDLELAIRKFKDFQVEQSIYIVDVRQSLHFKQVFKALELMGQDFAKKSLHLSYEMVELPSGAMSSRNGNIVPLQDLIDQMEKMILEVHLEKYKNEWSADEIYDTCKKIANAAIKYGMLKIDSQKKITFDLKAWLKVDGNTGPYLLYTYARIESILKKFPLINNLLTPQSYDYKEISEKNLLLKLWEFNDCVLDATLKYSPSILTNYLYQLCQDVNTFYAQCSIGQAGTEEIKNARLTLLQHFQKILKQGLHLCGIETVQRM